MGSRKHSISLATPLSETGWLRGKSKLGPGLVKLGIATVGDALAHYPRRHEDRTRFDNFPRRAGEEPLCLRVLVTECRSRFGRGRARHLFEATVTPPEDGAQGTLDLCWFNLPFLKKSILVGHELIIYGVIKQRGRRLVIDHPEYEVLAPEEEQSGAHLGRIVPIYPLTGGVNQKTMRSFQHALWSQLDEWEIPNVLPLDAVVPALSRREAIRQIHYPDSFGRLQEARRYLALEEMTRLQITLLERRELWRARGGIPRVCEGRLYESFLNDLPYQATSAQLRSIAEIRADLASSWPMMRLLQGDVGSGKTLVAAAAILFAVEAGADAALMAPTQILAEQHYRTFAAWCEPLGVDVQLLTANHRPSEDLPLFDFADGAGNAKPRRGRLTIGTHALLYRGESFPDGLGLVVIDEQHKFGVGQRQGLIDLGGATPPDVLLLSATPIPRTLSLACYGDLDLSVLDELPADRGKVITRIRQTSDAPAAAAFVKEQVEAGRQAYVVYPLIDESEKSTLAAATAAAESWKGWLPGAAIGLLHGRLSGAEKEEIMSRFRDGMIAVLVATSVIEVGVDVANATVMLIFHAERFGLAQLHQLRGRIGRGSLTGYCVLMIDPKAPEAHERLAILEQTRDGFRIAAEDLRQRGPGELLGTVQSGLPDLTFAEFWQDEEMLHRLVLWRGRRKYRPDGNGSVRASRRFQPNRFAAQRRKTK